MRHVVRSLLAVVGLLSVLCAGAMAQGAEPWEDALPVQDGWYVLSIGNSLNGGVMDALAGPAFTSDGVDLYRALLYKGGRPLQTHYEEADYAPGGHNGKGTDPKLLRDRSRSAFGNILQGANVREGAPEGAVHGHPWDVVILQDWRHDLRDYERFAFYVRRFDQAIRKQGGHTVLFSRFPGRPKEGKLEGYLRQLDTIDTSNRRIAREIGADVVPISRIYYEIEKARQANAELPDGHAEKKQFLPDDDENPRGRAEGWFEPGFLYGDGIHQGYLARGVYVYAFYTILRRSSPEGKNGTLNQWRGYDESEDPELDRFLEGVVWKVVKENEPWAGDPDYVTPERSGSVRADYDPGTGRVTVEVTGRVTGLRLGSPGAKRMVEDAAPRLGELEPVDGDAEIYAWYAPEDGIPAGRYDLGRLVQPGTPYEQLFFGYTPAEGPVGEMEGVESFADREQ